ncbi:MAG: hypothetical protein ACE15F_19285 [bacterium]
MVLPGYEPQERLTRRAPGTMLPVNWAQTALAPATQALTEAVQEERAYWENNEAAKVLADAYRIGDDLLRQVDAGELQENEDEVQKRYREALDKRLEGVDGRVRSRASVRLAEAAPYMESRLIERVKTRRAERDKAGLITGLEDIAKQVIDAPTHDAALMIWEQLAGGLDQSGFLGPVEKQVMLGRYAGTVWTPRVKRMLEQPDVTLDDARAQVERLPGLSADQRENLRQMIEEEGGRIKRTELSNDLADLRNIYVTNTQDRDMLRIGVAQMLEEAERQGVLKPGERLVVYREWNRGAQQEAMDRDVLTLGAMEVLRRVEDGQYGFDETDKTDAIELLKKPSKRKRTSGGITRTCDRRNSKRIGTWNFMGG